jgi:glycosyltransferase involved in cell wall biosynthesis
MQVIISAYTCAPGRGSEPGAGWEWTRAAALKNDITLLTRERYRPTIEQAVRAEPQLRLRILYISETTNRMLLSNAYGRYAAWQASVVRWMRRVGSRDLQIVHHLTFATDWLPAGVLYGHRMPAIWGPVGGYAPVSVPRIWHCGPRDIPGEIGRELSTRVLRRLFGDPSARKSAIVLAQNHDVARRFSKAGLVLVQPNVALPSEQLIRPRRPHGTAPTALFVGRLVGWKGWRLALAALARPEATGWQLRVIGCGRDRSAVEREVNRRGLTGRVRLLGQLDRNEVLGEMLHADALLQPSLHDGAGWAVAEAMAMGCPVVCVDVAGPSTLVKPPFGEKIPLGPDLPRRLALALNRLGPMNEFDTRWSRDRLPELLSEVYAHALASSTEF